MARLSCLNLVFLSLSLSLCNIASVTASSLIVYKDKECKSPISNITAQDGYPDGMCTNITSQVSKSWKSFMFLSLDDGCAPTVYGADVGTDSCSGTAVAATLSTCYNTTWVEYSVDGCTSSSNASSSGTATGSGSTASTTTLTPTGSSTTTTTAATATTSSNASSKAVARVEGIGLGVAGLLGLGMLLM